MSKFRIKSHSDSPLRKRGRRGFRGYPVASVAFYGPDNTRASKVVVGIIREEGAGPDSMQKWFSDDFDLRMDRAVGLEIVQFIEREGGRSVVVGETILGCPHEEGIDYPDGEVCPECPFWAHRDRWSGETVE